MKVTRFKKLISWNLIALIGYLSLTITIFFMISISLASTQLHMRLDLDEFIYNYMLEHLIYPYLSLYKIQMFAIIFLLLVSIAENSYYKVRGEYGLRIFCEHEIGYSRFFIIGLVLNFCPLYMFSSFVLKSIMKIL